MENISSKVSGAGAGVGAGDGAGDGAGAGVGAGFAQPPKIRATVNTIINGTKIDFFTAYPSSFDTRIPHNEVMGS